VQSRFDLRNEGTRNEPNRFFWIVEVDPEDPTAPPVKHTAMGRFKHEGATVRVDASGHVVAYMGDDNRFDYLYKFVSRDTFRPGPSTAARRHNKTLLSHGDLYVARFYGDGTEDGVFDGTGEWLPLVVGGQSFVPGYSVEEVLVFTRNAADVVQPTAMDRPRTSSPARSPGTSTWRARTTPVAPRRRSTRPTRAPRTRTATSSSSSRTAATPPGRPSPGTWCWSAATPPTRRSPRTSAGGRARCRRSPAPTTWRSTRPATCGSPPTASPAPSATTTASSWYPVEGPERGRVQQFLAVPTGAETCGPQIKSEDGYVLVAVQHPGDFPGATYEAPASTFPYDGVFPGPRPACVQVLPA
jgi:secreted PhoX family phosphatase